MIKSFKAVVLLVAFLGGVSSFAQTEVTAGSPVKDAELHEFAKVFKEMQENKIQFQTQALGVIKENGLTPESYQKMKVEESQGKKLEESEKDLAAKVKVDSALKSLQTEAIKHQQELVNKSSLGAQRLQEISMALQKDKSLQDKLRKMLADMQSTKE